MFLIPGAMPWGGGNQRTPAKSRGPASRWEIRAGARLLRRLLFGGRRAAIRAAAEPDGPGGHPYRSAPNEIELNCPARRVQGRGRLLR